MQRRAVAVYAAVFLLIAAASYGLVTTAETPRVAVENPDYKLTSGETFSVGGQTYTAATVEEVTEDGGHGSSSTHMSGTIEWNMTDVENTDQLAVGDTAMIDQQEWAVQEITPPAVTFEAVLDRTAILEADPDADNQTYSDDSGEFVIVNDQRVAASEYFDPATTTLSEGETASYEGTEATVDSVTNDSVQFLWRTDESQSTELAGGDTIELADGNEYIAYFESADTIALTNDHAAYQAQIAAKQQFADRSAGLQYAAVVSLLIVLSLVAFAFLPSRY